MTTTPANLATEASIHLGMLRKTRLSGSDFETFVPRAEVDPVYFNTPYYVYPDGPIGLRPSA